MSGEPARRPASRVRLGEPVELPWWALPAMAPPLGVLVASLLVGHLDGRLLAGLASLGLVALVGLVATRVRSRNLQSVYVSAGYGVWFFAALIWLVEVAAGR